MYTKFAITRIIAAPLVDDAVVLQELTRIMRLHGGNLIVTSMRAVYIFPEGTYAVVDFPWSYLSVFTIHFPDGATAQLYILPSGELSVVFDSSEFSASFQRTYMRRHVQSVATDITGMGQ